MDKKGVSNHPIVVLLGLLATAITLYGFFTGKFSIQQIFDGNSENAIARSDVTRVVTIVESEPEHEEVESGFEPLDALNSTPDNVPLTRLSRIKSYDLAEVSIRDWTEPKTGFGTDSFGKVIVKVLVDGAPYEDFSFALSPTNIDTLGKHVADFYSSFGGETDYDGIDEFEVDSGLYSLYSRELLGNWGEFGKVQGSGDSNNASLIVFPVEPNKVTEVLVNLSAIELQVFNSNGTEALYDEQLLLYCQGSDVAGNLVPSDDCTWPESLSVSNYPTGLARFAVGTGTYFLLWDMDREEPLLRDVMVGPHETVRESVYLPVD